MAEVTQRDVEEFLKPLQGREIDLKTIRSEMKIKPESKSWDGIRTILFRLTEERIVKPSGKRDGVYKVITQVRPVSVFGSSNHDTIFDLRWPRDYETGMEFPFAEHIVVRPGDLMVVAGVSNYGKTAVVINFLAENVDYFPCVLMGNEFTTADKKPTPRLLSRLRAIDWVEWTVEGRDKFVLLPVWGDYEEHVQKGKVNLIDWINIETGEHYLIGPMLEKIKRNNGDGLSIAVIQKEETKELGRGAGFTRDFADVYLTIDSHGEFESRLTVGKVKECKRRVTGRSWAFRIDDGAKISNVREVKKCFTCNGKGYTRFGKCNQCQGVKYVDRETSINF